MITTLPLNHQETHQRELHAHAVVLAHVWTQVPALTSLLDADPLQGEDACTHVIERLHLLHTVAEATAAYVEPRPLLVSLSCRLAPAQVTNAVEDTIRSLVLLRDTYRSMPWATMREYQHTLSRLRALHTLVQHTMTILKTEARETGRERRHSCHSNPFPM